MAPRILLCLLLHSLLLLAAGFLEGLGQLPGSSVQWLKTEDLLQPLREGSANAAKDNNTATFRFDREEGVHPSTCSGEQQSLVHTVKAVWHVQVTGPSWKP